MSGDEQQRERGPGASWALVLLGLVAGLGGAVSLGISVEFSQPEVSSQALTAAPVRPHPGYTKAIQLTILHTNDVHGQVLPLRGSREPSGLVALGLTIRAERKAALAAGRAVLLLDAGDIFQGTPEGNITRGDVMIAWMNHMGYDAMTVGNHEFDYGVGVPQHLATTADFPILGANVRQADGRVPEWLGLGSPANTSPSMRGAVLVKTIEQGRQDLRVALIGLTSSETKLMTSAGVTEDLEFRDEAEVLEQVLASLPQTDLVVLLTHCGFEVDRRLAERFAGRIDVIIGGHSHTKIETDEDRWVGDVLIAQTGDKAQRLGRVDLSVELPRAQRSELRSRVTGKAKLIVPTQDEQERLLAPYLERAERELGLSPDTPVGLLAAPLKRIPKFCESSSIGNLLADLMREHAEADLAFQNKTGIRSDLRAGPVTWRDCYQVSPFGNTVVKMLMRGSDVRALIESMLGGRLLEVSGASILCDPALRLGKRVLRIEVGGEALDDEALYVVATNSFLAGGKDGHEAFSRGTHRRDTKTLLRDLTLEFFRARSPYDPGPVEQRIRLRGE